MVGRRGEEYEVWTLLSAFAGHTDGGDLGPLVETVTYRNPALLAKMATTLDVLSGGSGSAPAPAGTALAGTRP